MIALNSNCLLFELSNGESVPCSAEMICIEIIGSPDTNIDPEMLQHAAASVFYYFKHDLQRDMVTVGEFAGALERVLRNLGLTLYPGKEERNILESDLSLLARESGVSLELFFFPRLRDELRFQLRQSPRMLRFHGLRRCVKRLTHARRWSARCERLQEQIVEFLRQCLNAEPGQNECSLVVE
ncbi:MAG TPA: hypothetical protein VMF08_00780 [Candidatus Sulfotelmatobacter sp.]|nr:hypothetical protein [Candidatus Sulfotelmatobacter sp.]